MAEFSAATACCRAVTAEGVVWGLFFTEARTEFTDLGAPCAQTDGERRGPAHPLSREQADVRAVPTESNTAGHQILLCFVRHADHVVPQVLHRRAQSRQACMQSVLCWSMEWGAAAMVIGLSSLLSESRGQPTADFIGRLLGKPLDRWFRASPDYS